MDDLHHKSLFLAYFLLISCVCLSEAAILGGQPKRASEEDVSARFFVLRNRFSDFVSDTVSFMESFRRRNDSEILRFLVLLAVNAYIPSLL
jgi:hypothetical protein